MKRNREIHSNCATPKLADIYASNQSLRIKLCRQAWRQRETPRIGGGKQSIHSSEMQDILKRLVLHEPRRRKASCLQAEPKIIKVEEGPLTDGPACYWNTSQPSHHLLSSLSSSLCLFRLGPVHSLLVVYACLSCGALSSISAGIVVRALSCLRPALNTCPRLGRYSYLNAVRSVLPHGDSTCMRSCYSRIQ
jgi:hypothetical protein